VTASKMSMSRGYDAASNAATASKASAKMHSVASLNFTHDADMNR
jgi:hypothetical protein